MMARSLFASLLLILHRHKAWLQTTGSTQLVRKPSSFSVTLLEQMIRDNDSDTLNPVKFFNIF